MTDDLRNQVFNNLNLLETDDLIDIWKKNDRVEWSETAFDVVREILQNRLVEIPKQNEPILEYEVLLPDEKFIKSQVMELAENNDINSLVNILENNSNLMESLEAAMALAQLGDERGLNFLITSLIFPDPNISSQARKILVELNNPEGNAALDSLQDDTSQVHTRKKVSIKKYSFLAGYASYITLTFLASILLSFTPFPSFLRFVLLLIIGYYIFKFVVNKTVLSFT
jgi:hypothetical protein